VPITPTIPIKILISPSTTRFSLPVLGSVITIPLLSISTISLNYLKATTLSLAFNLLDTRKNLLSPPLP
jgi:hypothetical protein